MKDYNPKEIVIFHEEPIEVIHERLQFLWDCSDNYHDSEPLTEKAKEYDYVLKGSRGSKIKKETL